MGVPPGVDILGIYRCVHRLNISHLSMGVEDNEIIISKLDSLINEIDGLDNNTRVVLQARLFFQPGNIY